MTNNHPIAWTTTEVLDATGGELLADDQNHRFANVSIDSRKISTDDLFVAVVGDVHDGHAYAADVINQGVRGLVIARHKAGQLPVAKWQAAGVACVAVDDTTRALGDLAAFNRRRAKACVVAITGSNGKTTTRQLTAAVLTRQFNTLVPVGNFNNQIGLPLTLLRLTPAHQWAVLELGTNSPGEISRLAAICSPDIAVITNIGPAHLQGLGSLEGVRREKGDLLKSLGHNGKAALNADDPRVIQLARETDREVLLFGLSSRAAVRAENVTETDHGITFALSVAGENLSVRLNSAGRFMVANALAAAAVGHLLGIPAPIIKAGLEDFSPVSNRMNLVRMANGITIINDTYNANPDSMKAALDTLKSMSAGNRALFVAGDMLELGDQAETLHRQIGAAAVRSGVKRLWACGKFAGAVASGARTEGMPPADTITGTRGQIIADLQRQIKPGDWVLVKGSRGMAMEKVVEGLKVWAENPKVNIQAG